MGGYIHRRCATHTTRRTKGRAICWWPCAITTSHSGAALRRRAGKSASALGSDYPEAVRQRHGHRWRPPRHTFFFPGEQYRPGTWTRSRCWRERGSARWSCTCITTETTRQAPHDLVEYLQLFARHGHFRATPGTAASATASSTATGACRTRAATDVTVVSTASLEQHLELAVHTTVAAIPSRVREAPIAVDEGVTRPVLGVARKVAMALVLREVLDDVAAEAFRGVGIVMEVQLDLSQARSREIRQQIEILRPILLAREEESVTGSMAVAVAKPVREPWVVPCPSPDAVEPLFDGRAGPEWLVVIAERKQHVARSFRAWGQHAIEQVACIAAHPTIEVLVMGESFEHVPSRQTSIKTIPRISAG